MFTVYFKCLDERHSRTANSSTNIKSEVTQSASQWLIHTKSLIAGLAKGLTFLFTRMNIFYPKKQSK